jgi:hypothetical protein
MNQTIDIDNIFTKCLMILSLCSGDMQCSQQISLNLIISKGFIKILTNKSYHHHIDKKNNNNLFIDKVYISTNLKHNRKKSSRETLRSFKLLTH